MRDGVIEEMRRVVAVLAVAPVAVIVFGSFARGEPDAESDIDAVFARPASVDESDEAWSVIHAATNAADVVCGVRLGKRAAGQDHDRAGELLKEAGGDGAELGEDLRRLLPMKAKAEYDPDDVPLSAASKAVGGAWRGIAVARRVVASTAKPQTATRRVGSLGRREHSDKGGYVKPRGCRDAAHN